LKAKRSKEGKNIGGGAGGVEGLGEEA